jgi:hypothetical protein
VVVSPADERTGASRARVSRRGFRVELDRSSSARFDKAAKDEVEAEELAGEGHGLWTARVYPKTQARVGRTVELAVDTSGVHFFDKDTGLAIGHPATQTTNGETRTGAPRSV